MAVTGPDWNAQGREMSLGRYPLQVEQAVSNPVTRLVPGVTSVTVHARYYALHGLLAHQAAEENLSGPEAQTLLRRCEVVMGAASLVDDSATATFYGRPHGADAMQQVSSGGNLDVDAVSCRGAYSSSDWGFRGPYLGAERVLGIVDAGTTWKPGKRFDHNAARPVLGALLELAAQPTVSAAQLRQVAPAVSIYRCAGAPDGAVAGRAALPWGQHAGSATPHNPAAAGAGDGHARGARTDGRAQRILQGGGGVRGLHHHRPAAAWPRRGRDVAWRAAAQLQCERVAAAVGVAGRSGVRRRGRHRRCAGTARR